MERLTTSILKVDLEENKEFLDKIELFDENKLKNLLNKFKNSGDYMKKSLEIKVMIFISFNFLMQELGI